MKQDTVAIVSVGVALAVRMLSGEVRVLAERVAKVEGQNEMALRLREAGR